MKGTGLPARALAMSLILLLVLLAGTYGPLGDYLSSVKRPNAADAFGAEDANAELLSWIKRKAPELSRPAIDAVNDRVWRAIPGYDGQEVDVQATYRKALAAGVRSPFSVAEFPWVYREIKPRVGLEDLPLLPIYRGNPAKSMVALMINVAWGDEHLPSMLEQLEAANVHATFFLDGMWLSKHMDTAKDLLARGHELSNHAYSHPNMSQYGAARQREEIAKTEKLLKELGVSNRWFAPPSGDYNEVTVKVASELGLRTVLWTLDTLDWKQPPSWSIVSKVSARAGPGTLILMHPTASAKGALTGMIKAIRAKGYTLGTVSETLSSERA